MKQRNSTIGIGTAAIGRPKYINLRQDGAVPETFSLEAFKQAGLRTLDAAYDEGVRYFDTAPGYGMAEQLLIDWAHSKKDDTIEVATKWGYTYVANFDPNAKEHEVKEHSLTKLNEQWEQSKKLLPLLKVYQIHSATFETGVLQNERVLNRLAELKSAHGLLIGITTSGTNQNQVLESALNVSVDGRPLFDLFQVTYNIFDQSLVLLADTIIKENRRLVIKEALANGRVFPNKDYPDYQEAYDVLQRLATKYEIGVDAVALRFCLDSIPATTVLSGAASREHLLANLEVSSFKLSAVDIAELKQLAVRPENYWSERKQLGWN